MPNHTSPGAPETAASPAPLLTQAVHHALLAARESGAVTLRCSLDLGLSQTSVRLAPGCWTWEGREYPYLETCKARTIYHWQGAAFEPVQRFVDQLIKLIPTDWGPPTFEIDGIKMLPTARVSPYDDAEKKVRWVEPQGKVVLDTCGGLGYFAAWCLKLGARQVLSFEKNPSVLWLREINPWSPRAGGALGLVEGDIALQIAMLGESSVDAVLHDPPRFGIAGELYSQAFYRQLARVLRPRGRLFHYTGTPNKLTSGRDVPREVAKRLALAGFKVALQGDGVLAVR